MAKTICPRCAAPLRGAARCDRCGPVVSHVLDPGQATATWPEARRWLDDIRPPTDRRRRHAAVGFVLAAALVAALALL